MRKYVANSIIVISVIAFVLTIFWVCWETTHPPKYSGRREGDMAILWCLAGALLFMESILFLAGRYLRRLCADEQTEEAAAANKRKLLPLAIYLGGSICAGLFGAIIFVTGLEALKPFWVLMCPPFFLSQTLLSVFGIKLQSDLAVNIIISIFCLVYYLGFFYPPYYLAAADRACKPSRYQLMKVFLVLFFATHFLIVFLLTILVKA